MPVTDGVGSWLGESVPDAEAELSCDGVAVDVRPPVTLCVGETLRVGPCDAEAEALGERDPLGLVLAVPLRDGELLGDSVRAWLGDAVAAWLRDADSEGVDDAVSVTERVRDSLRVAVIEGERVLVRELDAESEGVLLPDPLPVRLGLRVGVSLLLPLALGVSVFEDVLLLPGDWLTEPVADELGVRLELGESVALGVGSCADDLVADCDPVGDGDREEEALGVALRLGVSVALDESDCEAVADSLVVPVDERVNAWDPERVAETEGDSDGEDDALGESVELADWDKVEVPECEGVAEALAVPDIVTLPVVDCEVVADTLGDIDCDAVSDCDWEAVVEELGVDDREGDDEVEPVATWVTLDDAEGVDEALGDAEAEGVSVTLGVSDDEDVLEALGVADGDEVGDSDDVCVGDAVAVLLGVTDTLGDGDPDAVQDALGVPLADGDIDPLGVAEGELVTDSLPLLELLGVRVGLPVLDPEAVALSDGETELVEL